MSPSGWCSTRPAGTPRSAPCRVGALIGSRGSANLDAIAHFGFFLDAVLQIRDDIESVTDRQEKHGKDFGGDIIEGKQTLLLIHLLGACSASERAEVEPLPASEDKSFLRALVLHLRDPRVRGRRVALTKLRGFS